MLEIGCAWSKGSGERLQGHHGPLVCRCIKLPFYRALLISKFTFQEIWSSKF